MNMTLIERNALRRQIIELDVQREDLLKLPLEWRNTDKIERLELSIWELERQIHEMRTL